MKVITLEGRSVSRLSRAEAISEARELYQTDEVEIDDNARLSRPPDDEGGTWVAAWVWVPYPEVEAGP